MGCACTVFPSKPQGWAMLALCAPTPLFFLSLVLVLCLCGCGKQHLLDASDARVSSFSYFSYGALTHGVWLPHSLLPFP